MKVGICGQGFVGSAIREGLCSFHEIRTFDIKPQLSNCESLREMVAESGIIFICLPTPMRRDGSCDARLVRDVVLKVDGISGDLACDDKKVVVIKSTVPPGTTLQLDNTCSNIDVVFSPEFLTEANSFSDFKNQTRIILGGPRPATSIVKTMFRKAFPNVPIIKTGSRTAETVKYFTNCFLATKISFANEIKQICDTIDVDYDKVVEYALYDGRLGTSHWSVPGPDGDLGFGGHCFPKDLNAMIDIARNNHVTTTMLNATWNKNNEVRTNKDWETMSGRAVTDD